MAISIPAIVNPHMLTWAREQAGYHDLEKAAEALDIPIKKIQMWESGVKPPSIHQAEKLAKGYHCSYSIFTLNEPPKVVPLASEYRRLSGVNPGKESPELRFALRDMIYRRSVALNLLGELGDDKKKFDLSAKLLPSHEKVAMQIRQMLNVDSEIQFAWKNESQSWKGWRSAVEDTGVLVLLFTGVELEEIRGVSIFHPILPVIGINNKERTSRTFTLLHEFVHILLKQGNEEDNALDEKRTSKQWNEIESYVEHVAGAILMPSNIILNEEIVGIKKSADKWTISEIQKLSRKYSVTPLAVATRLMVLGVISFGNYRNWRKEWNKFLKDNPPKKPKGFATHAEKALNRNGLTLTNLVIDALNLERITSVDASRYLRVGYPHIEDLRMFFTYGRPLRFRQAEVE